MEILKAKELGFCAGVRRAIVALEKAAEARQPVASLGAVVHNRCVTDKLAAKGITVVGSLDDVAARTVAISSHGVGPKVVEDIKARGLTAIDTTCPRVRYAQRVASQLSDAGFYVVVFGDANHPEVKGVLGWAGDKGIACQSSADLPADRLSGRVGILSQTTQTHPAFSSFASAVIERSLRKLKEVRVVNTICEATSRRQTFAADLAKRADLVIVIGGRSSSNTRRLAEVCRASGVDTYLVESASEVQPEWLRGRKVIGVTGGTSTPDDAIEEVVSRLRLLSGGTTS